MSQDVEIWRYFSMVAGSAGSMLMRRFVVGTAAVLMLLPVLQAQSADLVPQGMDALAAHASFSTSFTFNKDMLNSASQMLPDEDRPIVAKLRSITVYSYRFPASASYDAATLNGVRAQYQGHGWQHLVTKQAHPESENPMRTDVWVRMKHADVQGMVLLVANERNVNLVVVDGMLSPLDLLHLRGHFGIPQFSGDDFVEQK